MKTFKQLPLYSLFLYKNVGEEEWRNDICVRVNSQSVNNAIDMTNHKWVSFDQDDTNVVYGLIDIVEIDRVIELNKI